jgi:hypothetical protein
VETALDGINALLALDDGPGDAPNMPASQRRTLVDLQGYLSTARDGLLSTERYPLASSKLSFALCQLQYLVEG